MIIDKWKLIAAFTIYFIIMGLSGSGCSKGIDSPLAPDGLIGDSNPSASTFDNLPIAFSDSLPNGGNTGIGAFGVFNVIVDPKELTAEISSFRSNSAIGDSYIVDISDFLSITPCGDCVNIDSVLINSDNNVVIRFGIRHPFEPGTLGEPPSYKNRLDLHVFDVFGILHFPGELQTFPLSGKTTASVKLVNADGYTDRFDERIDTFFPTEANLHPYKVMTYDPTDGNYNSSTELGFENILNASGHNILAMGGETQYSDFELKFETSDNLSFTLVVTAAYGHSALKDDRLYPVYYLPEFNRKEAWKVDVEIAENNLFHQKTDTYCELGINIWDWNQGANIDSELAQKDSIKAQSNVISVVVEIPGVTMSAINAIGPLGGDGQTSPLEFTAQVFNVGAAETGLAYGLVKVTDSRLPGLNAGGVGDAVDRDGGTFFDLAEFATYQSFEVDIYAPSPIPVIDTVPEPPAVYPNEPLNLDGANSYDYDGSIVSYEWDFDYNGTTFNVDFSGPTPASRVFENNHNSENIDITIALRVTDDNTPTPFSTIGTKLITVLPNRSPVADFSITTSEPFRRGDTLNFDASASYDPDNDTIKYEWDFDYQPGEFTKEDIAVTPAHIFNKMGAYIVALRVADQGLPEPRRHIYVRSVYIIPRFEPSLEIDNTMQTRQASHTQYSEVICADPNSDDIYVGYSSRYDNLWRIRVQRSADGGQTWGVPKVINNSQYETGQRGLALCVVPDTVPGTIYAFWISQRYNSSSVTYDGWNIRMNNGVPIAGNDVDWDESWNVDITMWCLSEPYTAPEHNPYKYSDNYYQYSEPSDLCVVVDPISIGSVYLAYVEGSSTVGRSVRLIKNTNITGYPSNVVWQPMTTTSHVDSTSTTVNFDQVNLAIDYSHNVYVAYDDNANGQIKIRKYPYGMVPGNPVQVIASDPSYANLHSPRISIDKRGNPVVVYCDTNFQGGTSGVSDIVMSTGIDSVPVMGTPTLVNSTASQSSNQLYPEIVIHKDSGMTFVFYEDRRNHSSYGEIYWTVLDPFANTLLVDELVNTSDPAHTIADFDICAVMSNAGTYSNLVTTWEQYSEDTWAAIAY